MSAVTFVDSYNLTLAKDKKSITLAIRAYDSNHAQAQASDICRSLNTTTFELTYGEGVPTPLSELFEKLAFNTFTHNTCAPWKGKYTNMAPCVYVLGKRIYVKYLTLRYLDIPNDFVVRPSCKCKNCVNPYHFTYTDAKNSKLTSGDLKLLTAYRKQGTDVNQIAKAFNVHRSTVYRKLNSAKSV
jgi:IS30 family transposase